MKRATWNGVVVAESEDIVIERAMPTSLSHR